ncbi:zinc finger protein ZAT1-like isoform X1 [Zingiber officinale]|uniref:zinc finger protein ZAT1-like isoform X1 n=2 Tax=Zingiber officinale TaxID=94328 RepID=UPI001C4AA688|nr:zinc finger protein ZAT1-like isoform X1 [Zingiber officinale]
MEGGRPPAHLCKVCEKSFPSGQSLGGHMRSHHIAVAGGGEEPRAPPGSYRLRVNPKKTWRMSGPGDGDDGEKRCGECGKEFLTWRALFGHSECHFLKPKPVKQFDAGITSAAISQRRRMQAMASCSFSSSEHEREDADGAIGLMMLSRDCRCWAGDRDGSSESSDKGSEFHLPRKGIKKMEYSDDQLVGDLDSLKNQTIYPFPAEIKCSSCEESGKGFPNKKDRRSNSDCISLGAAFQLDDQRSRFQSADCKNSFQALGGHRASHKKTNCCPRSKMDSARGIANEESVDGDEVSEASFGSTKKRCHPMIQLPPLEMANSLDLNLPAGVDGDAEFDSSSWIR